MKTHYELPILYKASDATHVDTQLTVHVTNRVNTVVKSGWLFRSTALIPHVLKENAKMLADV